MSRRVDGWMRQLNIEYRMSKSFAGHLTVETNSNYQNTKFKTKISRREQRAEDVIAKMGMAAFFVIGRCL